MPCAPQVTAPELVVSVGVNAQGGALGVPDHWNDLAEMPPASSSV